MQLAIEYGIKFMETSAKASINVEEVRKVFRKLLLWEGFENFHIMDYFTGSLEGDLSTIKVLRKILLGKDLKFWMCIILPAAKEVNCLWIC